MNIELYIVIVNYIKLFHELLENLEPCISNSSLYNCIMRMMNETGSSCDAVVRCCTQILR